MRKLILYKFTRYPIQTFTLLRRFIRYMPLRDVVYLHREAVPRQEAGRRPRPRCSRARSSTPT